MASEDQSTSNPTHTCLFCGLELASKNKLFKHIRTSAACADKMVASGGASSRSALAASAPRRCAALLVGYSDDPVSATAAVAAAVQDWTGAPPLSLTRASAALKHTVQTETTIRPAKTVAQPQQQRDAKTACGDVFVVAYNAQDGDPAKIMEAVNSSNKVARGLSFEVRAQIFSAVRLPAAAQLDAGKVPAQRAYHYLLPLRWLTGGAASERELQKNGELEDWLAEAAEVDSRVTTLSLWRDFGMGPPSSSPRWREEANACGSTRQVLRKLKEVLRGAATASTSLASSGKNATGVQLRRRNRGKQPALQRLRVVEHISVPSALREATSCSSADENSLNATLVIEIRGNELTGIKTPQRVISAAVAINNGWIPSSFWLHVLGSVADRRMTVEANLQPSPKEQLLTALPLAPDHRLYMAGARFDDVEVALERVSDTLLKLNPAAAAYRRALINEILVGEDPEAAEQRTISEAAWLHTLEHIAAPQIRAVISSLEQKQEQPDAISTDLNHAMGKTIKDGTVNAPEPYRDVLRLLRMAAKSGRWPQTSVARLRVMRPGGTSVLVISDRNGGQVDTLPAGNKAFPELASAVFALEAALISGAVLDQHHDGDQPLTVTLARRKPSQFCMINANAEFLPHTTKSEDSLLVALGDFTDGGDFIHLDQTKSAVLRDVRYRPFVFDGRQRHWNTSCVGERFSCVWFNKPVVMSAAELEESINAKDGLQFSAEDTDASALAASQSSIHPLLFRPKTTDALVMKEILGRRAYAGFELQPDPRWPLVHFAPAGHVVVDLGAHIGVFARYALAEGASRVFCFEPEPGNLELLNKNLSPWLQPRADAEAAVAAIYPVAICAGQPGSATLMLGKPRPDGMRNTWRHALQHLYSYSTTKWNHHAQPQQQVTVTTIPLFGASGVLAATSGATFVKLDVEGAELQLLGDPEDNTAGDPHAWLGVTHVILEWSFTKDRRMVTFGRAITRLRSAGFTVMYDFAGGAWESMDEWPWHTDVLVFAARELAT